MAAATRLVLAAILSVAPTLAGAAPVWSELPTTTRAAIQGMPDLAALAKKAAPAVVSITVEEGRPEKASPSSSDPLKDFFDHFYGDEPAEGLGTGFIIRSDGLILTNQHVVEDHGKITVEVDDHGFKRQLPGRVVGVDKATDMALLKVESGDPLPVLPLGDSDGVSVADWVVAIGNPFGLSQSVTFGIVSQIGRSDITPQGRDGYFDFIQTDASINPGNSGGPLLNLKGEVIAINNAINASGQGIGFSVPINMAKAVIPQLLATGKVQRSWIGVSIEDLPFEKARKLGMDHPAGVLVSAVSPGGPAAKAGMKVGDVIVGFGGRPVSVAHRLRWEVAIRAPGSRVAMEVLRAGSTKKVDMVTGHEPPASGGGGSEDDPMAMPSIHFLGGLGLAVEDTDKPAATANDMPAPTGAEIVAVDPDGVARKAGLQRGDIVLKVDGAPVQSAGELGQRIGSAEPGKMIELRIRRGGKDMSVPLRLPG